jgi:hypothetical protein
MSISVRLFAVAALFTAVITSARSYAEEISPATVAKTFTTESMSGCLQQFDAQGIKPRQELNTKPETPEEEVTFEAAGIKCTRAIINPDPRTRVAPGSKEVPPPDGGCRFLFGKTFISVVGNSPKELRVVILYPKHNFTLDIDPDSVQARTTENVPMVPDFDQLVRAAHAAIAVCLGSPN